MRYEAPNSIDKAVELLAAEKGLAFVLAGGTDLLVRMKSGFVEPDLVVDVKRIAPLRKAANRRGRLPGAIENDRCLGISHRHRRLLCQSPEPTALPCKSTIFASRRPSRLWCSLAGRAGRCRRGLPQGW